MKTEIHFHIGPLPANDTEALGWLLPLVNAADNGALNQMPASDFKRGWFAISFLFPGLHPDDALDHGTAVSSVIEDRPDVADVELRLLAPWFVRSGWPVRLAPVADEARRRYEAGELLDEEFYCSEAVVAGLCSRNPELAERVRAERTNSVSQTG